MSRLKGLLLVIGLLLLLMVVGCTDDASMASYNLSVAADQFEIYRRVVFYNGITNDYILMVEGYCSIEKDNIDNQLELTVKTDTGEYIKHYLGISDNVTYFVEQLEPGKVSTGRYRVVFKPSVIIPDVEYDHD